jgi:DNA mismatch repair protein MutS2
MQRLEESKRIADDERRRAERLSRELEELKKRYEARLRDLEILRREAKERATEEAKVLIRRNTEKMENIIGELRRLGKEGRKTQSARKKMKDTSDALIGGIGYENDPLPVEEADVPKSLRRGDLVRVVSLGGAQGEVLADSEQGEVPVRIGAMRVTVPLSGLRVARNEPGSRGSAPVAVPPRGGTSVKTADGKNNLALAKAQTVSTEVNLIGGRVEAALPRLDKYLDDAYAAGLESARIVHGKGTGALRQAIWQYLKGDNRVASFAMADEGEGGAGATVVRFKE